MSSLMKTLTIGDVVFTIVDDVARTQITALQNGMNTVSENIEQLQQAAENARNDIDTVMGTTVSPDTSLSISGVAADSKATGDAINQLNNGLNTLNSSLPTTFVSSVDGKTGDVTTGAYTQSNPPPYPVKSVNGKTGSVTLSASDVGAAEASHSHTSLYSTVLVEDGWSESTPYTQTVSVVGLKSTDNPIIDVNMSEATADNANGLRSAWNMIGRISTDNDSLTAYCYEEVPTVAVPLTIFVVQ